MPQDAFTLRYLCEELNLIFANGKVNRITEPSNDELILTVYTGKRTEKLLLNVNPSATRIGIVKTEKESPLTAPNFCMLMRKHLLSATILGMELVGFDRIIKIDFMASGEFFDSVKKTVYVELMGRYSNVILTENGKVLGGNRGINMFDDGVRPLINKKLIADCISSVKEKGNGITTAPATVGLPNTEVSPSTIARTSLSSMLWPASTSIFSRTSLSPTWTLYCFPPFLSSA